MTRKRVSREAGFTLIEVMVVVVILALLAGIATRMVIGRVAEARRTRVAVDLKEIAGALKLYKLDNGVYPSTEQGLDALVSPPTVGILPRRWNPEGYLEKVPLDPWGHPYLYLSDGKQYKLASLGADGEEGGEDENADIDSKDL